MTLEEKDKYIADYLLKLSAETLRFMVADLHAKIEDLEQNSCGDCTDGWRYNRVEVRHACTCMTEMEPFQILQTALEQIYKAGTGEIQIAEDDTEGMAWVATTAEEALQAVSPIDYM